jgi:hypothetical protein
MSLARRRRVPLAQQLADPKSRAALLKAAAGSSSRFRDLAQAAAVSLAHQDAAVREGARELVRGLAGMGRRDVTLPDDRVEYDASVTAFGAVFRKALVWAAMSWSDNAPYLRELFRKLHGAAGLADEGVRLEEGRALVRELMEGAVSRDLGEPKAQLLAVQGRIAKRLAGQEDDQRFMDELLGDAAAEAPEERHRRWQIEEGRRRAAHDIPADAAPAALLSPEEHRQWQQGEGTRRVKAQRVIEAFLQGALREGLTDEQRVMPLTQAAIRHLTSDGKRLSPEQQDALVETLAAFAARWGRPLAYDVARRVWDAGIAPAASSNDRARPPDWALRFFEVWAERFGDFTHAARFLLGRHETIMRFPPALRRLLEEQLLQIGRRHPRLLGPLLVETSRHTASAEVRAWAAELLRRLDAESKQHHRAVYRVLRHGLDETGAFAAWAFRLMEQLFGWRPPAIPSWRGKRFWLPLLAGWLLLGSAAPALATQAGEAAGWSWGWGWLGPALLAAGATLTALLWKRAPRGYGFNSAALAGFGLASWWLGLIPDGSAPWGESLAKTIVQFGLFWAASDSLAKRSAGQPVTRRTAGSALLSGLGNGFYTWFFFRALWWTPAWLGALLSTFFLVYSRNWIYSNVGSFHQSRSAIARRLSGETSSPAQQAKDAARDARRIESFWLLRNVSILKYAAVFSLPPAQQGPWDAVLTAVLQQYYFWAFHEDRPTLIDPKRQPWVRSLERLTGHRGPALMLYSIPAFFINIWRLARKAVSRLAAGAASAWRRPPAGSGEHLPELVTGDEASRRLERKIRAGEALETAG